MADRLRAALAMTLVVGPPWLLMAFSDGSWVGRGPSLLVAAIGVLGGTEVLLAAGYWWSEAIAIPGAALAAAFLGAVPSRACQQRAAVDQGAAPRAGS